MNRSRFLLLVAALAPSVFVHPGSAQDTFDVRAHYDKREVMIPMRDGVELFTVIYTPKDTSERYPILLTRTAYGIPPYGPDAYRVTLGPSLEFTKERYVFVYQDTRGKFKSEGEFVHHVPYVKGSTKPNESTDTFDSIEWLLKNAANHNGRVGQWGISWSGWEVSQGISSWFPMFDRNPQTFVDVYHAKPSDYRIATQKVYRSPELPSYVTVQVARGR